MLVAFVVVLQEEQEERKWACMWYLVVLIYDGIHIQQDPRMGVRTLLEDKYQPYLANVLRPNTEIRNRFVSLYLYPPSFFFFF
jgi:hypothetical protein